MTRLANPTPLFLDGGGGLLDAGYIYIGTVNTDPTIVGNQLPLFWDAAMTIAAPQPLRTLGGRVVNGQNPSFVYFSAADYAITIKDVNSVLVEYIPDSTQTGTASFQPLDSDLTTISGQTNAAYGLALLETANQAALQSTVGVGSAGLLAKATSAQFRNNTANVVLTPDNVWGAATYVALAPGATVNIDLSTGINFTLAMGGNYTLAAPTNAKEGQSGNILITQDGTGSRTLAYNAIFKPVGGSAPVLSTAANARDCLFYEVLPGGGILISLAKNVPA
jgi:hypothetical protein